MSDRPHIARIGAFFAALELDQMCSSLTTRSLPCLSLNIFDIHLQKCFVVHAFLWSILHFKQRSSYRGVVGPFLNSSRNRRGII
jgi:hypothetical protein